MDLITPNRLKLGQTNERGPNGCVKITLNLKKILKTNQNIFNVWFENWLLSHVPKLIHQPKWFRTEYHLEEGDVVLLLKQDSLLNKIYQYGIVISVEALRKGLSVKKKKKKLQNGEIVYVTFWKFWIVDMTYLITEQWNWPHTQFVCAWICSAHSVYLKNIKEAIITVIINQLPTGN